MSSRGICLLKLIFCFKLFFDTRLMEKIGCHFFPPKLGYFWGPFEKFDRKQGKTGICYHKNDRNICSTSFLIVLGSGNPNFGARILSVQNLMSIILFILQFCGFCVNSYSYGEMLTFKY